MKAENWISVLDFARRTGLTPYLVRMLVGRGEIPTIVIGTKKRIHVQWVTIWRAKAAAAMPKRSGRTEAA